MRQHNCEIPRVKTLNQLIFIPIRVAKEQFVPSEQSHLCCVCGSQFSLCGVRGSLLRSSLFFWWSIWSFNPESS